MSLVVLDKNNLIMRTLTSVVLPSVNAKHTAITACFLCPLFFVSSLLLSPWAAAETAPDSGSLLQQQVPTTPLDRSKNRLFDLQPLKKGPDSWPFYVAKIEIKGNVSVSDAALADIIGPFQHRKVTLNDLQALCQAITQHYRQQGYLFSRAVVPQQRLKDGKLILQVIEARLGDISLNNQSSANSEFLNSILASLPTGEVIKKEQINRALLLLQDVPGITVNTAIRAGASLGLSDLRIVVKESAPKHQLSLNNYASRYVDRLQVSARLNYANLLGQGDALNLSLNTNGQRLLQGGLHYSLSLNANSDKLGVNVNHLDYALGGDLKDLDARGQASTLNAYWQHNWLRALDANLYSQWQVQRQTLNDSLSDGFFRTKRHTDTLSFSLSGDLRDGLVEQSISSANLRLTVGDLSFENSAAQARDLLSANSEGSFSKINLNLQHRQALHPALELSVRLSIQQAQSNLDSSEKFNITGPYGVRAHDGGGVSADSGWLANIELQHRFAKTEQGGFALYGFVDGAKVKINQAAWSSAGDQNRISLAGAGLGVRWQSEKMQLNTFIAMPIGNTPELLSDSKKGLLWFSLNSSF
ncbi:MAG: hypothetical protein OFPII_38230 [Osedax symbiont Rs1]|nr:MAG: hypothetical protein OFPII_38230 [Osedax symbiont Rs1]